LVKGALHTHKCNQQQNPRSKPKLGAMTLAPVAVGKSSKNVATISQASVRCINIDLEYHQY
jgi:hypothetical protein